MIRALKCSLVFILFATAGCIKDEPPVINEPVLTGGSDGVYIANEGNFQFGNASISYYEDGLENAVQDVFEPANGRPLGDVCQSMRFFNGKAYVVVNNSGKIEVVNEDTFVSEGVITGLTSPRYFLPINKAKAYVTDLFADAIHIIDLNANSKMGEIACPGWTEELILAFGNAFITNRDRNYIFVINTATDQITDSLEVGYGANSIVEDKNGKLWVACSGSSSQNENASLHRINAANLSVEQSLWFPNAEDNPADLCINGSGDTLYYLNQDVYRLAISNTALATSAYISGDNRNYYSLAIHSKSGDLYLSDAIDFVQRGNISVYQSNGRLKKEFLAGIIPGGFYFR